MWLLCALCGSINLSSQTDTIPWSISLDDIVVTAQFAPTDSRNAIQQIKTIKRATIEKRGATNLQQLLSQEANIRINQDLVLGSSMSLLGVDGQNVKVMIDGVPVIGRLDGNVDLSQINLNNIERVEIVEGPLSVSYGTDALAGVINLITKKSQLKKYRLNAASQLENRGENTHSVSLGSWLSPNVLIQITGGYDDFKGFGTDSTRSVLWNPKAQKYTDAQLRWNLKNSNLRYAFGYFDELATNLGDVRRPQFKPYAWDDFYQTYRTNHSLTYEGDFGKTHTQTIIGYNQFKRFKNTIRTNFEEDTQEEVNGQQDTSRFNGAMLRSTWARELSGQFNLQVGLDLRYDNVSGARINDTLSAKEGFSKIGDYAIFSTLRYQPTQRLVLEGGVRYAYNTRYAAPLTPSLNLKHDLSKNWKLRASYGKGFRSPDLKELFFNFVDVNHFIIGNPNLGAEEADNVQVGFQFSARKKNQKWTASIKGFYNNIYNKIGLFEFEEVNGELIPATGKSTGQFAYFNQEVFRTHGVNTQIGWQRGGFNFNGGLSLVGYFNSDSEQFEDVDDYSYAFEWSNELSYSFVKSDLNFSLFTRANDRLITYFPEINDDGEKVISQQITDGFTLMDFTATKLFWKKRITFSAGVKNLLDIQQINVQGDGGGFHSGGSGVAQVGTGRNFFVRTAFNFDWK